jgi:Uma2 family endonuclease
MTAVTRPAPYTIKWEKLPDDYVLDDAPVDNINQPAIAAALTESLELAEKLLENAIAITNYGICATVNDQIVVKAPDWGYVSSIRVAKAEIKRSYTPQLQGETPTIVMEFLSDTKGSEYSIKPTYPPGKWFFYEQILKVPYYAIFEPDSGLLELYQLKAGQYSLLSANPNQRFWIAGLDLELGVWQGSRASRTGYWLRWWEAQDNLQLWGSELAEQERQRAEQEHQRAEQLLAQLRAAGLEPEA